MSDVSHQNMRIPSRHSLLLAICLASFASFAESVSVPTLPEKAAAYPWVTFLSQGPIDWFAKNESAKVQGQAYRAVILTGEIYSTVLIERVTLGTEGCCKKVTWVRQFDLKYFSEKYGFIGELAGFEFVRWLGPTSFVFRYRERNFVMSEINKPLVKVEPYVRANTSLQPTPLRGAAEL